MKTASFPRVVVVGAGIAGQELAEELQKHHVPIRLIGFIDDDPLKQGKRIKGLPILGRIESLSYVIRTQHVAEVYVAIPSASGETTQYVLDAIGDVPVRIRIVPRWLEIVQGSVDLTSVRSMQPEDLLGRPLVQVEQSILDEFFRGETIFVSGGAGSVGSELVRQLLVFEPKNVIVYDWWENGLYMLQREVEQRLPKAHVQFVLGSMQDKEKVHDVMQVTKPRFVYHASAFKHVPMLEDFPEEAVRNNIFATKVALDAAQNTGVERFLFLSTDKAVNPKSVMGMTKKIAEGLVLQKRGGMRTAAVRFGNVLESFGSILPLFRTQVARGGPVTVTDENMSRYFMTIPEAVQLLLHAMRFLSGRDIFVLDMGEPINILELTKRAIRLMGFTPGGDIKIQMTRARPGEKMREELFTKREPFTKTALPGIFKTTNQEKVDIDRCLSELRHDLYSSEKLKGVLKRYAA